MITNDKFILDAQGRPVPETDLIKWAEWLETADRVVGRETIGPCKVSTVFLGLDHRFGEGGPPILWETMVFGGPDKLKGTMKRCAGNREQAEAMHNEIVEYVKAQLPKEPSQ